VLAGVPEDFRSIMKRGVGALARLLWQAIHGGSGIAMAKAPMQPFYFSGTESCGSGVTGLREMIPTPHGLSSVSCLDQGKNHLGKLAGVIWNHRICSRVSSRHAYLHSAGI